MFYWAKPFWYSFLCWRSSLELILWAVLAISFDDWVFFYGNFDSDLLTYWIEGNDSFRLSAFWFINVSGFGPLSIRERDTWLCGNCLPAKLWYWLLFDLLSDFIWTFIFFPYCWKNCRPDWSWVVFYEFMFLIKMLSTNEFSMELSAIVIGACFSPFLSNFLMLAPTRSD